MGAYLIKSFNIILTRQARSKLRERNTFHLWVEAIILVIRLWGRDAVCINFKTLIRTDAFGIRIE